VSSRLYSEAQAVAHQQIDRILAASPFNITSLPYRVPAVLCMEAIPAGSSTCTETASTSGPRTTVTPNVFVYTDPVSGRAVVTGTMSTTIENVGATMTYPSTKTAPLNVRKATVVVSYRFREKNYNVTMTTLRTADQ
jgi:hypothetical protein